MGSTSGKGPLRRRCAIYTRKSSEEGLEQSFNSLDAQREACEAYIRSQRHEGWATIPAHYDDGGFSGGTMQRPALTRLMEAIEQGSVDIVVVYKVDRLSRSLADFVRIVEHFDGQDVSFVSVTQQFNTSSSMGRLTLNVLLSFAQFEREVTGERIRDKIAASKKKGLWMGGVVPLGYDVKDRALVINETEARTVRHIYDRYLALRSVRRLKHELDSSGYVSKARYIQGRLTGRKLFSRGALYTLLKNPLYVGKVAHKNRLHEGLHRAIVPTETWKQVQTLLSRNRQKCRVKTAAKDPALLAGFLFDDRGNPMSSSHATKKNRRYRYYVSQAVLQYREQEAGTVTRIPAPELESIVVARFRRLLGTGLELSKSLGIARPSASQLRAIVNNGKSLASDWDSLSHPEQVTLLKTCINRITVGHSEITLSLSADGLLSVLPDTAVRNPAKDHAISGEFTIDLEVETKRCGKEARLVFPTDERAQANQATVLAIQNAMAKALSWNEALVSGTASSLTELAAADNVTQRYVAHLIKLAYLSPDIQEAINSSTIPADLTLDRLKYGFPLDWITQREELGFSV